MRLHHVPQQGTIEEWAMVIDNEIDLKKYHSLDASLHMEALLNMGKNSKDGKIQTDHLGGGSPKEIAIGTWLKCRQLTAKEGEKIYPLIEIALMVDKKYLGMLKHISTDGAIRINKSGGWCSLRSFIETWDAEILEEIDKDSIGFPVSDDVIKADTLILENSLPDYCGRWHEQQCKEFLKEEAGIVKIIYGLKEVDTSYVEKCIINAKNIFTSTELQDENQLNEFMTLFSKLPRKNIYLDINKRNVDKIKSHSLFETNNSIHNIQFIKS